MTWPTRHDLQEAHVHALRRPPDPSAAGDGTVAGGTAGDAAGSTAGGERDGTARHGALERVGVLVGALVDRALAVAVVAFAAWTLLYELALAQLLP
ncbi:hypothetical protein, partial [Cellulomonas cellasea]